MNARETRYLLNKYRDIHVTLLYRFFHFCAIRAFAKTSSHSTLFVRHQTWLTEWFCESFFSSNSLDSDVMIDVHDKQQTIYVQTKSDKMMIKWWERKRRENVIYVQSYSLIFSSHAMRISRLSYSLIYVFDILLSSIIVFANDENFSRLSFKIKTNIRIRETSWWTCKLFITQ